ncbi:alpha/beta fold hydrolase [Microbulbifer pacificus]|uniref:alpha/beta fold hydrolase n=1 Tax=Microbulbifer pacificus TaxID=407164 RepID=UPI001F1E0AD0|nr:alpha/beta fold hydrolase [Microbulbifer pacificus]
MTDMDGWLVDPSRGIHRGWFLFAHGAGAPMDSDFMQAQAEMLAAQGMGVIRFEFPYMAERRETGRRRPPSRIEVLLEDFQAQIDRFGEIFPGERLFIGGKSMGGRVASMLAGQNYRAGKVAGVVCLGYPFHPPGKPESLRTAHLECLESPALIVQGTRDKLGNREEVESYTLSPVIDVQWLDDGDHDFNPRKASGWTQQQHWQSAADRAAAFMRVAES